LIRKLIYLTVTRPDIIFVGGALSRFMHQPIEAHWSSALRILAYLKSCPEESLVYRKHKHVHISDTLIQVMLVTEEIRSLLLSSVLLLEEIL